MSMPVATVNENYCPQLWKNQVGFPGKAFVVKSVTEAAGKKKFSNQHLRLGIFAFDLAHVEASGPFVVNVCHAITSSNTRVT